MQKAFEFEMPAPDRIAALERHGRQLRNAYIRGLITDGAVAFSHACRHPVTTAKAVVQR